MRCYLYSALVLPARRRSNLSSVDAAKAPPLSLDSAVLSRRLLLSEILENDAFVKRNSRAAGALVEDHGETVAVDAVLVRRIESFQVDTGGDGAVCSMATRVGHEEKFVLQSSVFTQSSEAVNFRT